MDSRHNNGVIYTNEKCVGCNRCVHTCPTLGANISTKLGGRICSVVSDNNCIHCGRCINDCTHGARMFRDNTQDVLNDLKKGEEISFLIDPMFYLPFSDNYNNVFGYLKSLGVKGIYDAAVGGSICLYEHVKYLKEHLDENGNCEKFLAHICPGFSNYVSKYKPRAIDYFIPVQTPDICAAIFFKKYKKVTGKIALVTPCTAIYDEISSYSSLNSINYIISLSSLRNLIEDVDLSQYYAESDFRDQGIGNSFIEAGKFTNAALSFFKTGTRFNFYDGFEYGVNLFFETDGFYEKGIHPKMVEIDTCNRGCVNGPTVLPTQYYREKGYRYFSEMYSKAFDYEDLDEMLPEQRFERICEAFNFLNDADFEWECEESYIQRVKIPKEVIDEIFESMYKDTEDKRHLDCGACGHRTCLEMAIAIGNGFSRIEDCVHYMNDEMKVQLGIDPLTGLMNRRAFIVNGERILADYPDKDYVLVIGDINGLGGINDLYGNAGGDTVIQYVGGLIRDYCANKGICARLGGGSYGALVEASEENKEQFFGISQISVEHLGIEYPLSIKFGVYDISDHDITMNKAIMYATYAYRCARDKSRNTFIHYTEKMTETMFKEAEVTQKMRAAMENGEFVIFLQPKYDHNSGKLAGAEVLSRWIKEDGSIVSPGIFIPVFEKNGYIAELDRYVWKSSFELIDKWISDGAPVVPVSVNMSRISLLGDDVIDYIKELDKEFPKIRPYIQFEITESAYVSGEIDIFSKIQSIRDLGFLINMDDFGSGYSSLNTLKDAPIDVLKLDMGFLRGGHNVEKGNTIISAVVKMAQDLGLKIVAEGVETKDQADMLSDIGCNIIQGYFYAKPMPVYEFEVLFDKTED